MYVPELTHATAALQSSNDFDVSVIVGRVPPTRPTLASAAAPAVPAGAGWRASTQRETAALPTVRCKLSSRLGAVSTAAVNALGRATSGAVWCAASPCASGMDLFNRIQEDSGRSLWSSAGATDR